MSQSLAEKYRPRTLDEIAGQKHLLNKNGPLRAYAKKRIETSAIFYGPPGTGKTTVARIIAASQGWPIVRLNATSAGAKELKNAIDEAHNVPGGILLYLDEIQYLNKKQQQLLLPDMESGRIRLIGSTTENPCFYVYGAILSRSLVFEFKPVPKEELIKAVHNAAIGENVMLTPDAADRIAALASGDARKALSILETAIAIASNAAGHPRTTLDIADIEATGQAAAQRYDKGGDETYDLASGLMKSLRGSDPDAALYYLARFLAAGDLLTPIRRILCSASEDIGLAYPMAAVIAKACCDTARELGLPEGALPLSQAVILLANAPKSNSAHDAVKAAIHAVENGGAYPPPRNLQNAHADTKTHTGPAAPASGYQYPHDYPNHWVDQRYLPDALVGTRFYTPGDNPAEQTSVSYWAAVKQKGG